MRARWAVPAALAVVLACAPARAELRARTRDLGAVSPVVSLLALEQGGSQDWGAGIPAPTIDCAPLPGSTGGDIVCSGANPTKVGSPTTDGSPIWYRGDTATRPAAAVAVAEYYTIPGVARTASFTEVFVFRPVLTATYIYLVSKGGDAGFVVRVKSDGVIQAYVNGATVATCGTATSGAWYFLSLAYERIGEGTSKLRCNLNGAAATEVTNAALLTAVGDDLLLTDMTTAPPTGHQFNGSLRRYSRFNGWAASAAELAALVASQWGLAADKPAGTVATHARTDSTLCCPFSDAECYWVGPGAPCIHAPTYQGWASGGAVAGGVEVYGPGANALGYSETFANAAWVKSAGVTAADASASCPMSPLAGTRMSLVTTDGEADQIAQDAATTPGRAVWLARATGDSACGVTFADADGTGAQSVALTDGPLRYWSGGTGQTGLSVARPVGGCARWCMWLAQAQASIYPMPPRSTPGATGYAGSASTATTLTVPVALTDPARWAISATGSMGSWATAFADLLALGTDGQANTAHLTSYNGGAYWQITDASAATKTWNIASHGYAAGSQHTWLGSSDGRFWADGALLATTASGTGSGVLSTLPATLNIGYGGGASGGSLNINGLVSRVVQCRRASGCR